MKIKDCSSCEMFKEIIARQHKKLKLIDEALRADDIYRAVAWSQCPVDSIISDLDWKEWSK